jgi:hypothetical protein
LLMAQAKRLTEIEAMSENWGVYIVYLLNFDTPIAKTGGSETKTSETVERPKQAGGRRSLDSVSKGSLCSDLLLFGCENSENVKAWK